MIDIVDTQTRSRMMAGIGGKDTKPELVLRRALHTRGLRYRLHGKGLQGKPDLVFPRFKAVIFVHGCFWHRHSECRFTTTPSTRPEFWQAKFAANVVRDHAVRVGLTESDWRIAVIWECALRKQEQVEAAADRLGAWLRSGATEVEIGEKGLSDQGDDGQALGR